MPVTLTPLASQAIEAAFCGEHALAPGSPLPVGVIGVNHKSADLSLRELLCKAYDRCFTRLEEDDDTNSFVKLNTCNRSELYFSSADLTSSHGKFLQLLRQELDEPFEHTLYTFFGTDCFAHLARVTSGLDSAVTGETEIQGQVKSSYEDACGEEHVGKELHFMFQKSLKIGKSIRNRWLIQRGMPDIEGVAHKICSMVFDSLENLPVLFVGASEINLKLLRYFRAKGMQDIAVCNRTLSTAQDLAREEGVRCVAWNQLEAWSDYSVVVAATKCPNYLLIPEHLEKEDDDKRILIDLSLPRNIDPSLGNSAHTLLFNIDQINQSVNFAKAEAREWLQTARGDAMQLVRRQTEIFRLREQKRDRFCSA